jgi:hypothetical protein
MGFTPPSRRLAHMRYSLFSLPPHRTVASLHRRRHYRFHSTKSYIWSGSLDFPSQSDALKRKLNQTQPNHTTSRTWAKIFTWNPKNQLNLKKITHTILNTTQSCYPANDQIVGASTPPPSPQSHGGERSAAARSRRRPHGLVPEPLSEITSEDDPERWGVVLDQFGPVYLEYYHSH